MSPLEWWSGGFTTGSSQPSAVSGEGHLQVISSGLAEQFEVVVNDHGRASVWPEQRSLPAGWTGTGYIAAFERCVARAAEVSPTVDPEIARSDTGFLPVHAMFEEMVTRTPECVAVASGTSTISYGRLNEASNRVARTLSGLGVGAESIVGLVLPQGIEACTAALGVWKAGAAFVPLDPRDSPERACRLLIAVGAKVAVVEATSGRDIVGPDTITVDEALSGSQVSSNPGLDCLPSQLAYAIFTSGTSGAPKAVLVEHRSIANLARWFRRGVFGITAEDRILQCAPPGVDAFVAELIQGLSTGATLVVASPDFGSDTIAETIEGRHVTVATLTPTVLRQLPLQILSGLRTLISAGEHLPIWLARDASRVTRLINAYGPTESTICASAGLVDLSPADDYVPLGSPVDGLTLHVLGSDGDIVRPGEVGELSIGGIGVARGYLGHPQLTAAQFVPDGFSSRPGTLLYRTGDRVRLHADHQIEYVGRVDDQVKIRGYRVELQEVVTALRQIPSIADAAVVAVDRERGSRELAASVVMRAGYDTDVALIRTHLREVLPGHMIPWKIEAASGLPHTSWGKVDTEELRRRALTPHCTTPAPATPSGSGYIAGTLAVIWRDLLGTSVTNDDNFFDVGGHSLLVMEMVRAVQLALGLELAVADVFLTPTISGLAELLAENTGLKSTARGGR